MTGALDATVDIDDTSRCPAATACEGCGTATVLAVGTAEARGIGAGVFCVTLCADCVLEPLPSLAPLEALTRVCRHAEHLGIDLDLMAELVRSAGGDRR